MTWLGRIHAGLLGLYAIWQGWGIIDGGAERFGGLSLAVLRRVVTFAPPWDFWGWLLTLSGALILAGLVLRVWLVKVAGLLGVGIWAGCFAYGAYLAYLADPKSPGTGYKTYTLFAVVAGIFMIANETRRKRRVAA